MRALIDLIFGRPCAEAQLQPAYCGPSPFGRPSAHDFALADQLIRWALRQHLAALCGPAVCAELEKRCESLSESTPVPVDNGPWSGGNDGGNSTSDAGSSSDGGGCGTADGGGTCSL